MTRHYGHPAASAGSSNPTNRRFDLAGWGLGSVAYVRPVKLEDEIVYGIYSANGTQLGLAADGNAAIVAARHNDLEPFRIQ
ncbi:hypothetical protein [Magnetospira sp. QH-2]|uniref:hypothetical protein n=1 Tax=Magnetospira sp. (strain QH-2) TaxID=1288970 RepID=UPI0003E81A62|nr:hypothetical protein [Magnetospira sp. QH-2]CCQ75580.1 conserved protein of unknown function [Magnetospira sp. QH-2]